MISLLEAHQAGREDWPGHSHPVGRDTAGRPGWGRVDRDELPGREKDDRTGKDKPGC